MTAPHPALVREVADKIAAGWSVEAVGILTVCSAPDGAVTTINCDSPDAAVALVEAAQA